MISLLLMPAFGISATVRPGDDLAAVTSSLNAGDVITFTAGVYELEGTLRVVDAAGEASDPVRLVPEEGAEVVLKATTGATVFELRNSAHVVVEGLIFEGHDAWQEEGGGGVLIAGGVGIVFRGNTVRQVRGDLLRLADDGEGYTIEGNHLRDSWAGTGLYAGCGNGSCWLAGSRVHGNLIHDVGNPDDPRSGIVLDNGCQDNQVTDNVIYGVSATGLRVESTQLGPENLVEGNAIWATGGNGLEVTGEALVRNNVVFQTGGVGIFSTNHENDDLQNVRITYNTVALTGAEGIRVDQWADKPGMVLSSNVVANITGRGLRYDTNGLDDEAGPLNYITNNIVSGLVEGVDVALYPDWVVPGAGVADFADVEGWDFYPAGGATMIDGGDRASEAWVPSVDFNGAPRSGESPTAGAYQWSGAGNPGWVIAEEFKGTEAGPRMDDLQTGGCCGGGGGGGDRAAFLLPMVVWFAGRRRRER